MPKVIKEKRYYNGCRACWCCWTISIEKIKKLFNCKYANVQPHSGAQANGAVFTLLKQMIPLWEWVWIQAAISLMDWKFLCLKWFNAIGASVDKKSELIDYDNVEKLALEHKPKLIIAGGSALE